MTVTKDSLIGDILDHDIETAQFFFEIGMGCLGCPHSRMESVSIMPMNWYRRSRNMGISVLVQPVIRKVM